MYTGLLDFVDVGDVTGLEVGIPGRLNSELSEELLGLLLLNLFNPGNLSSFSEAMFDVAGSSDALICTVY